MKIKAEDYKASREVVQKSYRENGLEKTLEVRVS